jgi:hypothetical protein
MKMIKSNRIYMIMVIFLFCINCAGQKGIDPKTLSSPDEKALYDLMVLRCRAIKDHDEKLIASIYAMDSPELKWIHQKGLPMWWENGVVYTIYKINKISIVGDDAAASFVLNGHNRYGYTYTRYVEVLYIKEGSEWKIESCGE